MPQTRHLNRPGGRIAYDLAGTGPLVIAVPGMGDLRSSFADLKEELLATGFSMATMDLRGHGDSDTSFDRYDSTAAGEDVAALAAHLGGPAILVGNSLGAGAAVTAAAQRSDLVAGLVLLGPFVRDVEISAAKRLAIRAALRRPWGPGLWALTYRKLNAGHSSDKLNSHVADIRTSLRRPGRWKAFVATTRTSHAEVEGRWGEVREAAIPVRVLMGSEDPDFKDPTAEAHLVAQGLGGTAQVLDDVGHYPQIQAPASVAAAVRALRDDAPRHGPPTS